MLILQACDVSNYTFATADEDMSIYSVNMSVNVPNRNDLFQNHIYTVIKSCILNLGAELKCLR